MDKSQGKKSSKEPSEVKLNPNLIIKIIMKKMDAGGSWDHDTNNNDGVKVKKESAAKGFCKNLFNLSSSSSNGDRNNNNSQQQPPVTNQYTKVTVDGLMSQLTLHQSRLQTNVNAVNHNSEANKRCNSTPDEQRSADADARARRALEIQEGVEVISKPEGYTTSSSSSQIISRPQDPCSNCHQPQNHTKQFGIAQSSIMPLSDNEVPKYHSQDYYLHFLVPDLEKITSCCYYWGKMDRYEAEKLLEGKPEGTFLLRDSAQDDYLFSVSFRKYGRSLHARIEQWNHKFSFDSHDPSVYTAKTVTGLVEHYKDPTSVMFFEPMLTSPLHRNYVFSLQQLCRASIVSHTTYDGINDLCLPATMKAYLKEYHYKLKIRARQFPEGISSLASS